VAAGAGLERLRRQSDRRARLSATDPEADLNAAAELRRPLGEPHRNSPDASGQAKHDIRMARPEISPLTILHRRLDGAFEPPTTAQLLAIASTGRAPTRRSATSIGIEATLVSRHNSTHNPGR
jgi:hypothetical protein